MPLTSYKSPNKYESFRDFIDRHIKVFKIMFMIFIICSITFLGAGTVCMINYNSVKGCSEIFIIGVCGTIVVLGYYILWCIFFLYDRHRGEEGEEREGREEGREEREKGCSIYDMV